MTVLMRVFPGAAVCIVLLLTASRAFAQNTYAANSIVAIFVANVEVAAPFSITRERLHALQQRNAQQPLPTTELPLYTNDTPTNRALLSVGVDRIDRILAAAPGPPVYRLRVTVPVRTAVALLRQAPGVAYASPEWYVTPMSHPTP